MKIKRFCEYKLYEKVNRINKELIKSGLKNIKNSYLLSYNDIKTILDDLVIEENKRKQSNQYIIDLEGDSVFKGIFDDVVDFIKKHKLKDKRNFKEYMLTTPTEDNLVLCYSDEFGFLF